MWAGWGEPGGEPVRVMTTRSCPFSSVMTAWPDWPGAVLGGGGGGQGGGGWGWGGWGGVFWGGGGDGRGGGCLGWGGGGGGGGVAAFFGEVEVVDGGVD